MTRRVDTQFRRAMRLPMRGGSNLRSIHARDGGRCHLCRQQVSLADATQDHLIPLAQDGRDTRANVSIAHSRCNTARGDLPLDLAHGIIRAMEDAGTPLTQYAVQQALIARLREWRAHRYDEWTTG